jgi:large subunit ribosomal protein L7/L12
MSRCPFCGKATSFGVTQCSHCGTTIGELPEQTALEARIRSLLEQNEKISAIKLFREQTGAGLKQARDAVDALERGEPLVVPAAPDRGSDQEILSLLEQGQKISAIKLYQERTGLGLKEAKEAVDAMAVRHGLAKKSGGGCLGMIVLLTTTAWLLASRM